jgi:hypothetical protein
MNTEGPIMDRVDKPLEIRDGDTEYYVAVARGFNSVAEFRSFRAAKETRNDARDYERRLSVLKLSLEVR